MDLKDQSTDLSAILKAPLAWLAVVADKLMGITLNDLVMYLAAFYTLLQIIGWFARKSWVRGKDE